MILSQIAPGHVRLGVTIAGVKGTLTAAGPQSCAADGEQGCLSNSSFAAAATSGLAQKILTGQTVAGIAGSAPVRPENCTADGVVGCVTTEDHKATAVSGLAAKVISTATVAGLSGSVVLPSSADVRLNVAYGPDLSSMGSYAVPECTGDGQANCKIPENGNLKSADTANFSSWDLRKKRDPTTGAVLRLAGISGRSKTCRNRANRGLFNNVATPASNVPFGSGTPDFFDTIDDFHNSLTGLPGEIPAWKVIMVGQDSFDFGSDFACGGIFATGEETNGKTGADDALAHDVNGNWQDLTPTTVPGGTPSQDTDIVVGGNSVSPGTVNGCNAEDKHCVFRELNSGIMVTEVSANSYTWEQAIQHCHSLGEAGNAEVTQPIPLLGSPPASDWRLPTQKELQTLSNAGMRGLNQTTQMQNTFGNVAAFFWSSSTVSNSIGLGEGWVIPLNDNFVSKFDKTASYHVVCVR